MIQIDEVDSDDHSSDRLQLMFRWIDENCVSKDERRLKSEMLNYVLILNDQFFVDIRALTNYIDQINRNAELTTFERRTFLTGKLIEKSRPERFQNNRYSISIDEYPYDKYPPYISTDCFLLSKYNAHLLNILTDYVRLFPFEHIYLSFLSSSILTKFIQNNYLFDADQFTFDNRSNKQQTPICYYGYENDKLIQLWNRIYHLNITQHF